MLRFRYLKLAVAGLIAMVLIGGVVAMAAPPPARSLASLTQPNVIFITVDALRADHVSSYGYARATTPNLDTWLAAPV